MISATFCNVLQQYIFRKPAAISIFIQDEWMFVALVSAPHVHIRFLMYIYVENNECLCVQPTL